MVDIYLLSSIPYQRCTTSPTHPSTTIGVSPGPGLSSTSEAAWVNPLYPHSPVPTEWLWRRCPSRVRCHCGPTQVRVCSSAAGSEVEGSALPWAPGRWWRLWSRCWQPALTVCLWPSALPLCLAARSCFWPQRDAHLTPSVFSPGSRLYMSHNALLCGRELPSSVCDVPGTWSHSTYTLESVCSFKPTLWHYDNTMRWIAIYVQRNHHRVWSLILF